ncbi:hypothetical protein PR048_013559 [Dryococelus australis]|uniref:Uncharacterized protein n=1 Tax=Dryococelus australis TaxID=614101 RepID=A0ABQ9HSI9_9NEOP|nr:hypothetical protein PR048_013559 [Dryococelus australis]
MEYSWTLPHDDDRDNDGDRPAPGLDDDARRLVQDRVPDGGKASSARAFSSNSPLPRVLNTCLVACISPLALMTAVMQHAMDFTSYLKLSGAVLIHDRCIASHNTWRSVRAGSMVCTYHSRGGRSV